MNPTQPEVPPSGEPPGGTLDQALALVEFLRSRCSWDAKQTPISLQPYLLEEAHEVADAVARGDDAGLRDELGDLLLNVAFQIVLAEERRAFSREDVVEGLAAKMRRRHPHIYGDGPAEPWSVLKARERRKSRAETGILDGLPTGLDPLLRAHHVQIRVAEVGFDWADPEGAWAKVREEVEEVDAELIANDPDALELELGDLLFALVNVARLSGLHASRALARANAKFERRFATLEGFARARGVRLGSAGLEELDRLWDDVKRAERSEVTSPPPADLPG